MEVTVENYINQKLKIDYPDYQITNIQGLTPSGATINTSGAGIVDGTFYNSSYVNQRNIVITVVPEGNAERARLNLYRYFQPKRKIRLFFKTETRDVYIDGYVESFEGSLYSEKQTFQISVICPQPFFTEISPTIVYQSFVHDYFTFPFSTPEEGIILSSIDSNGIAEVVNEGDETTGFVITLEATSNVIEPTIYNKTTRETFTFQDELLKGDVVVIDTRRGQKTIIKKRASTTTNLINNITKDSRWITLAPGQNDLTYSCIYGEQNLNVSYSVYPLYEGV